MGDIYIPPHRRVASTRAEHDAQWRVIRQFCSSLDEMTIEQMDYGRPECLSCFNPKYGILDEKYVSLPFKGKFFTGSSDLLAHCKPFDDRLAVQVPEGAVGLQTGKRFVSMSPYEVVQAIVRSGLFHNDQLIDAQPKGLRLTRHELEVNAKAFWDHRPSFCECTGFGTPTGSDYGDFPHDLDTVPPVESAFIEGKQIRTGFRLRSPEARLRRSRRKKLKVMAFVTPDTTVKVKFLPAPAEVCINLHFKYIPRSGPTLIEGVITSRKPRVYRNTSYKKRYISRDPFKGHTKYWYFARKREGRVYLSRHNPHGDDYLYLKMGIARKRGFCVTQPFADE